MKKTRIFIAIDPGTTVQGRLISMQENLKKIDNDVNWVESGNLHVTLLFLGEVNDRELLSVCRAVQAVTDLFSPFTLQVAGLGCFPNPRRPRILWAGIGTGQEEVVALHDSLEPPLLELRCYRREERSYTPHITLGRIKTEGPREELGQALTKYVDWKTGEVKVKEVLVMSSELTSQGPTYTVLSRAKLKG